MTSRYDDLPTELARNGLRMIALGEQMLAQAHAMGMTPQALQSIDQNLQANAFSSGMTRGARAKAIYDARRLRERIFPSYIFGEPAWDILLDLYIAYRRNRRLSVTAACIGAIVPQTTALRYLTLLVDEGLAERELDLTDNRRSFVSLTGEAAKLLDSFFEQTEEAAPAHLQLALSNPMLFRGRRSS